VLIKYSLVRSDDSGAELQGCEIAIVSKALMAKAEGYALMCFGGGVSSYDRRLCCEPEFRTDQSESGAYVSSGYGDFCRSNF
jgi:hypothetical protein